MLKKTIVEDDEDDELKKLVNKDFGAEKVNDIDSVVSIEDDNDKRNMKLLDNKSAVKNVLDREIYCIFKIR